MAGDALRGLWHPVGVVGQLTIQRSIRPVRVLGEGLVLYRDGEGRVGLIQERCTHHGVLLAYGRVSKDALVCPYHEWHFDTEGNCWAEITGERRWEMPWSKATAYPVEEYGGLYWAYLGVDSPPPLPRYDLLDAPVARRITVDPRRDAVWDRQARVHAERLELATPVDETHVWQVMVEQIAGEPAQAEPELVYRDPEDAEPLRGFAPSPFRW